MRFKKQICALIAFLMLVFTLVSCGGDKVAYPLQETEAKDTVHTEPPRETTDDGTFTHLIKNGRKYYRVIYPADAESGIADAAESLKGAVTALTGEELVVRSDAEVTGGGREILIGRTNREDSKSILGELEFLTFCVRVTDRNIVILGSNDKMTCLGVEWFTKNCIENNFSNIGEGYWRIASDTEHISPAAAYVFENFINGKDSYFCEEKKLMNLKGGTENEILRGACTDGKYYYCAFEVNENGDCVIQKVDPASGETLQVGKVINGLRAVDMTFCTAKNRIVAVDHFDGRSWLSLIDPNTLERVARYNVGESISAVAYVKETDSYFVLNEEKTALLTLNSSFKLQSRDQFDAVDSYGFDVDGSFIYVGMKTEDTNSVLIFSHGGELVSRVELAGPEFTPRNLIVGDAEFVLGYDTYFRGADIYEFSVKVSEKAS